jgi:hypothetical protein
MTENYNLDSESPKYSEVLKSNSEEIDDTQVGSNDNLNGQSNEDNDFKNKSENNDKQTTEEEYQADSPTKSQVDSNDNLNGQSNEDNDLKNKSENNDKQKIEEEYQADSQTRSQVDLNDNLNKQSNDDSLQEEYNEGGELENQTEDENQENKNHHIGFFESPRRLKERRDRKIGDLKLLNQEYGVLYEDISELINIIHLEVDTEKKNSYKKRKEGYEEKKSSIQEEIDSIENELNDINTQLKSYDSPKRREVCYDQLKGAENISPEIFSNKDRDPIEDTLYYVVTFFKDLSPYDFKRVVSWLLEGRKTTIQVKSQVTTEQGEIKTFEQSQEKLMIEIWHESCKNPDQILLNCGICAVTLEDASQVIDFFSLELREKFKDYFKHKQPFYLLEQYKKSRFLLFDQEEKVAKNVVSLFIDMVSISPQTYGIKWLFEIIEIINKGQLKELELLKEIKPNKRGKFIWGRFSSLLSRMLDNEKLLNIVDSFLNGLINQKKHSTVLQITEILFSDSNFNGIDWFKQILERCTDREKEKAYESLRNHCYKNNRYVFDLLKEIENWLPKPNQKNYSHSNEYALRLFPDYCYYIIDKIEENYYYSLPYQYSLFKALDIDDFKKKVNLLFTWLFHPETELENKDFEKWFKIDFEKWFKIFEVEHDFLLEYFHPLLLTEWCIILWGLDNKEAELEDLQREMIDTLIQQVVVYPASSQKEYKKRKEKFVQCWRRLAQDLLDKAVKSGKLGESNPKKKYMHRRNIVKYLNKQFNLQIKEKGI